MDKNLLSVIEIIQNNSHLDKLQVNFFHLKLLQKCIAKGRNLHLLSTLYFYSLLIILFFFCYILIPGSQINKGENINGCTILKVLPGAGVGWGGVMLPGSCKEPLYLGLNGQYPCGYTHSNKTAEECQALARASVGGF